MLQKGFISDQAYEDVGPRALYLTKPLTEFGSKGPSLEKYSTNTLLSQWPQPITNLEDSSHLTNSLPFLQQCGSSSPPPCSAWVYKVMLANTTPSVIRELH